jgi:hypothetical protein
VCASMSPIHVDMDGKYQPHHSRNPSCCYHLLLSWSPAPMGRDDRVSIKKNRSPTSGLCEPGSQTLCVSTWVNLHGISHLARKHALSTIHGVVLPGRCLP